MISVQNISASYKRPFTPKREILKNISLEIPKGKIVGILGRNGAGKTTLIRTILGLIHPDAGEISFFGKNPTKERGTVMRLCGVLLDGTKNISPKWNSDDVFLHLAAIYNFNPKEKRREFDGLLERFGLINDKGKLISDYSRGMKQKLSICSIMLHNPKVLILDEPTIGLDSQTTKELLAFMKDFVRSHDKSILITTHQLGIIDEISDQIHVLHHGKSIFDGTVQDLISLTGMGRLKMTFTTDDHVHAFSDLDFIDKHEKHIFVEMNNDHITSLLNKANSLDIDLLSVKQEFGLSDAFLRLTDAKTTGFETAQIATGDLTNE